MNDLFADLDLFPQTGPIDVLSGSSLNTFLRCAKQWEYAYIYRFRRPPALRMVTGTAGHAAAEIHMLTKRDEQVDPPLELALDTFSDTFALEAQETDAPANERGEWKDKGTRGVKKWHKSVAPTIRPVHVEQPISFVINGVNWTGTFDVSDEDDLVTDYKFTSRTPSNAADYLVNMVGYAIGFRELTGRTESGIQVANVVMLKQPTYVPIRSVGPVTDSAIIAFADIVESATRSIQAGIFPPNGLKSGACSWCGYNDICPAFKESPMRPPTEEVGEP